MTMTVAKRYAQGMLDLRLAQATPQQLASLTSEELEKRKQEFLTEQELRAEQLMHEITHDKAALWESYQRGRFHPNNKVSRTLFEDVAGIDLGTTCKQAQAVFERYVGADVIKARTDRLAAERQARQAEEDEKNRKIHEAFVSRMTTKVQADEMVCGEDLLEFARHVGIEVHPRTAGSLKRRIVAVNSSHCRFHGDRPPATVYHLYRQVREKLQPATV